jgi:hypothetical protein
MMFLRFFQSLLLVPLLAQGEKAGATIDYEDMELQEVIDDLKEVFESNGGFFHPNIDIGFTRLKGGIERGDDTPHYNFGLFVKPETSIPEGEVLLKFTNGTFMALPIILDSSQANTILLADMFNLQRQILEDSKEDSESPYLDFIFDYILEQQAGPPAGWTDAGKTVLKTFITDSSFFSFQNYEDILQMDTWDGDTELHRNNLPQWEQNLQISLSRARWDIICPIYDIIRHSNSPKRINVGLTNDLYVQPSKHHQLSASEFGVKALRELNGGDELFHSYGRGTAQYDHDGGYIDYGVGTAEIFRKTGIVEDYPQRFYFPRLGLDYIVHEVNETKDEHGVPKIELEPLTNNRVDDDAIFQFEIEFEYMEYIKHEIDKWESDAADKSPVFDAIPSQELKVAKEYIFAYSAVIELIIETGQKCEDEIQCQYIVDEEKVAIENVDSQYFTTYQCDTLTGNVLDNEFDVLDHIQSAYQTIDYFQNKATDDVCLFLDGVYQQCMVSWSKIIF